MNWEIKSLDNNYQVIDFDNKRPVIVGYEGNTEKILYVDVDKNTFLRSSADDESEEELTLDELKTGKFDQIPQDIIDKYLELLGSSLDQANSLESPSENQGDDSTKEFKPILV